MFVHDLLKMPIVQRAAEILGPKSELHIVGGAIRDILLGKEIKDVDFATKFTPEEMLLRFRWAGIEPFEMKTAIRRGTVTVLLEGEPVEITTFRNPESPETETQFTKNIREDLPARDFTINAMALNVFTGELVDPFGGKEDVQRRLVRAVNHPNQRFIEDPHRILRMIRFANAKGPGWSTDEITWLGAKECVGLLTRVSPERIRDELVKILLADTPSVALEALKNLGALEFIIPELLETVGVEQNRFHFADVWGHIKLVVDATPKDKIVRLAALFHDIGKPHVITEDHNGRHFIGHESKSAHMGVDIMKRLKFSNEDIEDVRILVRHHMRNHKMGVKGIRRLIVRMGEHLPNWIALKEADAKAHIMDEDFPEKWAKFLVDLEREKEAPRQVPLGKLAINGKDLIALGLKPGEKFGVIFRELKNRTLDNPELNDKNKLLEIVNEELL